MPGGLLEAQREDRKMGWESRLSKRLQGVLRTAQEQTEQNGNGRTSASDATSRHEGHYELPRHVRGGEGNIRGPPIVLEGICNDFILSMDEVRVYTKD